MKSKIEKLFSTKYYKEMTLLVIVLLLAILIWLNRYSYSFDSGKVFGWRINNFTGKGTGIFLDKGGENQ